ncbi:MAG: hypothetical protein IJU72_09555, partial [Bacteroidales bacterium]|nr:hypothetical protein [Bacteroidales bacterium]
DSSAAVIDGRGGELPASAVFGMPEPVEGVGRGTVPSTGSGTVNRRLRQAQVLLMVLPPADVAALQAALSIAHNPTPLRPGRCPRQYLLQPAGLHCHRAWPRPVPKAMPQAISVAARRAALKARGQTAVGASKLPRIAACRDTPRVSVAIVAAIDAGADRAPPLLFLGCLSLSKAWGRGTVPSTGSGTADGTAACRCCSPTGCIVHRA